MTVYVAKVGHMNIYDTVQAHTLGAGDQIIYEEDPIEIDQVKDEGDEIVIIGFSHVTGDTVSFGISFDTEVSLWAV